MSQEALRQFANSGDVAVNMVLLTRYRELGMTNDEFLVYLQCRGQMTNVGGELSRSAIAKATGFSEVQVTTLLEQMKEKGFLAFISNRDGQGRVAMQLDFSPLVLKLTQLSAAAYTPTTEVKLETQGEPEAGNGLPSRADIFNLIEQEFGRPLSSVELETISNWFNIDHFRADFIKAAVQEAVLNGALNLRYIEAILVQWQKRNFRSLQEVHQERQNRKHYKARQAPTGNEPAIPLDVDILNADWSNF